MMVSAIAEVEAEQEVRHAVEGSEVLAGLTGTPAVRQTETTKALSIET